MRLILNGINGHYLRYIPDNCLQDTELVEAAVAYATEESLLFEWCWDHDIPLRFWGRFDEKLPVSVNILKRFLDRRSPNFSCKLVRRFHAKVIWWHGVGAYIGSANFTDAAWYMNIEAGCFFDEADMEAQGIDIQLREFFRRVDEHAAPLTDELFKIMEARARELARLHEQDKDQAKAFLDTGTVHKWPGLITVQPTAAVERQRRAFLDEWYQTLQTLRDIGATISRDENRPPWIPADVPSGAQADQFLHAHYYNHVIGEDRRSYFEEKYEQNRNNPVRALREAIKWWHAQRQPPSNEDRMLFDWAPYIRDALARERILHLSESDFEAVCQRVWSIQDHARRVANATLNLPGGQRYDMETKTKELAHFLYTRRAQNGSNVLQLIHHVLYDGPVDGVPTRLWDAIADSKWRIEHFGISALGELVGWALPDKFPPRNNRTSKSLRALGYTVTVHGS
jgi:hypothetical protein